MIIILNVFMNMNFVDFNSFEYRYSNICIYFIINSCKKMLFIVWRLTRAEIIKSHKRNCNFLCTKFNEIAKYLLSKKMDKESVFA